MNSETLPSRNASTPLAIDATHSPMHNRIGRTIHRLRDCDGSELVEMAFAMPVFLMIVLAIFQFAIVMFNYESASFAIRQAARYGSTHSATSLAPCTSTQIASMVKDVLWSPTGSSTVTVTWPVSNTVGNTIKVSVVESYSIGLFNSSVTAMQITNSVQYPIVR